MDAELEQMLERVQTRKMAVGRQIAELQKEYNNLFADETEIIMEDYRRRNGIIPRHPQVLSEGEVQPSESREEQDRGDL